ncbi:MAG: Jacalin-like lectin domain protein [Methanosaeta sp. PtaB.Bin039]|nr:MAG: Jacalin-like lectin domain protein [Methanosaeta sp. PtaB.Bin039]OPY45078.1 MAG: Jacalin-like lectin domain protein [Methanosaeta sp. PtaU1.Bin028]
MARRLLRALMALIFLLQLTGSGLGDSAQTYRLGPSGGFGGSHFMDDPIPAGAHISKVVIHAGDYIDSIQLVYETADHAQIPLNRHGGTGGGVYEFVLGEGESIREIRGRCGDVVDSIQIATASTTSPAYGGPGGSREFVYQIPPGLELVGLWGQSGELLDALGIVLRPK